MSPLLCVRRMTRHLPPQQEYHLPPQREYMSWDRHPTTSRACAQDDTGHAREVGLQERKEELYMVRVEVQGFEGLVVEGMQQLLRRKQVSCSPCSYWPLHLTSR